MRGEARIGVEKNKSHQIEEDYGYPTDTNMWFHIMQSKERYFCNISSSSFSRSAVFAEHFVYGKFLRIDVHCIHRRTQQDQVAVTTQRIRAMTLRKSSVTVAKSLNELRSVPLLWSRGSRCFNHDEMAWHSCWHSRSIWHTKKGRQWRNRSRSSWRLCRSHLPR